MQMEATLEDHEGLLQFRGLQFAQLTFAHQAQGGHDRGLDTTLYEKCRDHSASSSYFGRFWQD